MTAKEYHEKPRPADESKSHDGFNLDGILAELGSFGKYQLVLLLLLSFRDSFLGMCQYNYVFTAMEVPFRCHIPECESLDVVTYNVSWVGFTHPNDSSTCVRAVPQAHAHDGFCTSERFDQRRYQPCDNIVYQDYNSIVAEFDLGCEPWKRTLIGTVHNLGLIFSFIVSGIVSDRYGRKVVIVGSPLLVGVTGLVKSFSVNYWMLIVLEFLETALGYGNASLVLSMEAVNQNNRVLYSCISDGLSNFGTAFFGIIAWKVPYWRTLTRAIYAPLLVAVFYSVLVDEGVRWLLAHDRRDEAVKVLNKVAKVNKVTLSTKAKEMLLTISAEKKIKDDPEKKEKRATSNVLEDLRSRKIVLRVALLSACFFCTTFVTTGAVVNATSISGNKYVNFAAMMLVIIPTRIVLALTLNRFGRKLPISISYGLSFVFYVSSAFVPKSAPWAAVLLYVTASMACSYGTFAMFVVGVEVFPTTSRNSLINIATTIGRFGSVLGPQTPLLSKYMENMPSMVIGLMSLGPCALALLLPDSGRTALPDCAQQAEDVEQEDGNLDQKTQPV